MTGTTKTTRQYYLAQIIFWGGYFLLNLVFISFTYSSPLLVSIFLMLSALLFLATHLLRGVYKKIAPRWSFKRIAINLIWLLPLLALVIQVLLFVITGLSIALFSLDTGSIQKSSLGGFFIYTADTCIMLILWCTIYLLRAEFIKRRHAEIAHWKLQSETRDAELQFLRSQISSHFIFNALNNLRSLIREDAERARAGLNDLAVLLRGLMHIDPVKQVKLRDELEWVRGYLALEALQFEHRLKTVFDIDETLLDQELPPLILQTLVENAVKHGVAARRDGGIISVTAKRQSDTRWQLMVINPCAEQAATHQGHGIGIRNAQQRLMLAYADQATLALHVDEVVTATVEMPL
ncbi:MAG: histidine kinase [Steroidobacter sp.]